MMTGNPSVLQQHLCFSNCVQNSNLSGDGLLYKQARDLLTKGTENSEKLQNKSRLIYKKQVPCLCSTSGASGWFWLLCPTQPTCSDCAVVLFDWMQLGSCCSQCLFHKPWRWLEEQHVVFPSRSNSVFLPAFRARVVTFRWLLMCKCMFPCSWSRLGAGRCLRVRVTVKEMKCVHVSPAVSPTLQL